eukprot:334214-Hanusia_phi.AAC.5
MRRVERDGPRQGGRAGERRYCVHTATISRHGSSSASAACLSLGYAAFTHHAHKRVERERMDESHLLHSNTQVEL